MWLRVRRKYLYGYLTLLGVVVLSLVVAIFLVLEVAKELRQLESAESDNVQWTLSQLEVEFLELHTATVAAKADLRSDLNLVRKEFDIFYSRVQTVSRGSLYAGLRETEDFRTALSEIQSFLQDSLGLIDADDGTLRAGLPALRTRIEELRLTVRTASNSGLFHFARDADERRTGLFDTLLALAAMTVIMVLALALMAYYFNRLNRQNAYRRRELGQINQRIKTILSTSLDAVVATDSRGRVIEFNVAAEIVFQRKRADVMGQEIGQLIVPEHLRSAHDAGMERMHANGEMHVVGKGRVRLEAMRADGSTFPVELALQKAQYGSQTVFIAFLRDISHRVAAENELVQARDRALAGEKAKAEFLAIMSHEIRTPLNGVLGNLSLIRDTKLSTTQSRLVSNMEVSGRILMSHVNTVLDITQYEAGMMVMHPEATDLNALLSDVVDGQTSLASAQNTRIEWGWVGPIRPWVLADPKRLQQILLNLVGNAVKFTPQGRITIEVEQIDGTDGPLEFRVTDTGVGIPDEDLNRIFEDFETRDRSHVRSTPGTGLGLGIARRIAKAMGGEIGASSTLGKGSQFWVRLPLPAAAPAPQEPARPALAAPPVRLKVLVVEDNEINRSVVRAMLEAEGHTVFEAEDGQQGLRIADGTCYDLILMDISMPVMNGHEATRAIRAGKGASRHSPIIAHSANVMPNEAKKFQENGMDGFLGKPLQRAELRELLASIARKRAAAEQTEPSPNTDPRPATTAPDAKTEPTEMDLIDREAMQATQDALGDAIFAKMKERFEGEMVDLLAWLGQEGGEGHALQDIAARSHKSASSAAVFGAIALRQTLKEIELSAKDGKKTRCLEACQSLGECWEKTKAALG